MRIGIFFGGQSREREISFAGGRTVYDNLNKNLFEAVPVFVDSLGNFILLDWQFIYKGTIRDFYPPVDNIPNSELGFQIYIESLGKISAIDQLISKVGKRIHPSEFENYFDFAFLALHGPYGEDGNIQGLLEWYNIPYSGSGILSSAIGINKVVQKKLMQAAGFQVTNSFVISKKDFFQRTSTKQLYEKVKTIVGFPMVIKAPYQGSSIGITVLQDDSENKFEKAVNKAFFRHEIFKEDWLSLSKAKKITQLKQLLDIREGIGMPVICEGEQINHPDQLFELIESKFKTEVSSLVFESLDNEEEILIEQFIEGKEFSCIVIQKEDEHPLALPPTEIVKGNNFFDYKSKYLPGMSRKVTPINIPQTEILRICEACQQLFQALNFNVYARIDGFITGKGEIFLNDPNTTSGMMPSSFFFHQAAEIGLNPSQFLTYIIRTSLKERIKTGKKTFKIKHQLEQLDQSITESNALKGNRTKVGVIMGGFSSERHISVESGRNIYEKLASSKDYEPYPIFLSGNQEEHIMHLMPVNIMLKDNADDIKEKLHDALAKPKHPVIQQIAEKAKAITNKYVNNNIELPVQLSYADLSNMIDAVFIALHGRPGEDGAVQQNLEKYNIPYNGSGVKSSQISINKYLTNQILRENGILVANHYLVQKSAYLQDPLNTIKAIETQFQYPIIAKPSDDGCSSAVKKIKSRAELEAFANIIFGLASKDDSPSAKILNLSYNEEFPIKENFLLEDLIHQGDAQHFLEVTGGLLTSYQEDGTIKYEVFEPSETLATGEILSLEEKFLAGEGQNITPARFSKNNELQNKISAQVRATIEKVAKIINVEGYCRIDAFVKIFDNDKIETYIIEINSLPGMTPATCIFHQTAINGYRPYNFIDNILKFGILRNNKRKELHNNSIIK